MIFAVVVMLGQLLDQRVVVEPVEEIVVESVEVPRA